MKKNIFILTILIGLLSVSCEDFLDVNTDPNNPTSVTPDLVLPVAQWYTSYYVGQDRGLNHLGNMMMYNWGEAYGFSWYDEEFKYLVTSTFYDQMFDYAYSSALKEYNVLLDLDPEYDYYKAIGMIMKAYHYQLLVDLFGDVPYTEALQRGLNPTPAYDDDATIYDNLLVQLSDAIVVIDSASAKSTTEEVGDDDAMFGGDMTMWKQFANTLKLRIITRISDVDAATVTSELAAIAAEGSGYVSSDVGINPGYIAKESGKQNPMWDELGWDYTGAQTLSSQATCATQYVLDYLDATNDPRISYIYEEPETGHLGVNQGADNNDEGLGTDFVSNIGPGILKAADMDAIILTLAEVNFNQAELAQKGFDVGDDAATFYYAGISASMDYLGVHDTVEAKYLLQTVVQNVTFENANDKLDAIFTQKWIATNGITAEQSWFDYSRTGYPSNLPVSEMASTPDRPVRLFYPASEITANNDNVPDQPNAFTDKIFWAQ